MRIGVTALAGLALILGSCGPKKLALPTDPIDRAATCGVVEVAHARKTLNSAKGPLPFVYQGRLLHYAMLAALKDDSFATDTASAVVARMPALEPDITGGKFDDLVAPCAAAFPETGRMSGITLPGNPADRRLGCYELAGFLSRSLQSLSSDFGEQLTSYGELRRRLDDKVGADLAKLGARKDEAQKPLKSKALAHMTRLGSPMPVMDQCLAAFPDMKKAA